MEMRHVMNFHPEWGCLAPAPSFIRTMRTVLVATAVGAAAGGGVVLSFADHSAEGHASVAERTLGRPIRPVSIRSARLKLTNRRLPAGVYGNFVGGWPRERPCDRRIERQFSGAPGGRRSFHGSPHGYGWRLC